MAGSRQLAQQQRFRRGEVAVAAGRSGQVSTRGPQREQPDASGLLGTVAARRKPRTRRCCRQRRSADNADAECCQQRQQRQQHEPWTSADAAQGASLAKFAVAAVAAKRMTLRAPQL
mmetsp:Transcript_28495/g.81945  ORF Transcript_28495/g.81945 Transcript_28495/m.81945 type:complete len:117 (+) Transcript_28495:136-486(+)